MSESSTASSFSYRLQTARKWRGLTQKELADRAGISVSLVGALEQDRVQNTRVQTVHQLAVALRASTTYLLGQDREMPEEPFPVHDPALWEPVRRALAGQLSHPDEAPTVAGVQAAAERLRSLVATNQYGGLAAVLPGLLRDADALNGTGRTIRSRLLNATGWVLVQTRQFDLAELALQEAVDAAEDRLDAATAIDILAWLHLRQGQLDQARVLATRWADDIEPRFSRATTGELTQWGRLLLRVGAAAVRDNRPGEAEDALRLARAAAVRIGREVLSDSMTARMFGPVTVTMLTAEHAAIVGKPDRVLAIAERVPAEATPYERRAGRNRHRLDVADALVAMGRSAEAVTVLEELGQASPEWLVAQRYARDVVGRVVERMRTLTPEVRALATSVGLAY
ncbi:helix-turn-helix domain-containing protein [Streptosporangium saharense]|uniref:helix-turn-helix domain-containing protein n=1 Tax=Streptosporangium saharense TaxID=1706840 RepID=UPI00341ECB3B